MPASPDRLTWTNELPPLRAIYERGGPPGYEYLYATPSKEWEAQEAGYSRVPNSPIFKLVGPKGESPFIVMRRQLAVLQEINASIKDSRKHYHAAPTISPDSFNNPVDVDVTLYNLTGLGSVPIKEDPPKATKTNAA